MFYSHMYHRSREVEIVILCRTDAVNDRTDAILIVKKIDYLENFQICFRCSKNSVTLKRTTIYVRWMK